MLRDGFLTYWFYVSHSKSLNCFLKKSWLSSTGVFRSYERSSFWRSTGRSSDGQVDLTAGTLFQRPASVCRTNSVGKQTDCFKAADGHICPGTIVQVTETDWHQRAVLSRLFVLKMSYNSVVDIVCTSRNEIQISDFSVQATFFGDFSWNLFSEDSRFIVLAASKLFVCIEN